MAETGIKTLTTKQMLELWRLRRYLEPLRNDVEVERTDGIDLDTLLLTEIDGWYREQLLRLEPCALPLVDCADSADVMMGPLGEWVVRLPDNVVRVVSVTAQGWHCPALLTDDLASREAMRQHNVFSRSGPCSPVGVVSVPEVRLYTPAAGVERPDSIMCVCLPPEGVYYLTPAMIAAIPKHDLLSQIC